MNEESADLREGGLLSPVARSSRGRSASLRGRCVLLSRERAVHRYSSFRISPSPLFPRGNRYVKLWIRVRRFLRRFSSPLFVSTDTRCPRRAERG